MNDETVKGREELNEITKKLTGEKNDLIDVVVTFARGQEELMSVVSIGLSDLDDPGREVHKAWIPVATQVLTKELAEGLKLPEDLSGVRVTQVYEGDDTSATLGLKVGDIIVDVDGDPVRASENHDIEVFSTMIRQYKIGSKITLKAIREGKPLELTGELKSQPTALREMKRYQDYDFEFSVRDVSYLDRQQLKLEKEVAGVMVTAVENGGWASLAGMRGGDLILSLDNKPIQNVQDVEQTLVALKKQQPQSVIVKARRGIHTMFLEIEPIWSETN